MVKKNEPKVSEHISDICRFFDSVQKEYAYHSEQAAEMDRLTQDYLHMLELDGLSYRERAKVATQLTKCRQTRREHKDAVQVLEPICEFLNAGPGRQTLNQLREILGKTRRIEERMRNRVYVPRVLDQNKEL